MTHTPLDVRPLTRQIGAEVFGVDLTRPIEGETAQALRQTFADHLVLFFRDQPMTYETHKAFGRVFGELVAHPAVDPIPEDGLIVAIHADANSKYIAGDDWHSDLTCNEEPPLGSALYLHTVPQVGGDTLFSSMYAAYDALSPRMKDALEGLTALHDADHVYRPLFPDVDRQYPSAVHPVVRTHPVTGRRCLFVNSSYTLRINELAAGESDALLRYLYQHCNNPNFQVRFRWRPHSIALWDNRCTQHMAVWDYFPDTRSGYRVTIGGDRPV
jgi:taurine dioxygenase